MKGYISTVEAARRLGISRQAVYEKISQEYPIIRAIKPKNVWWVNLESLERYEKFRPYQSPDGAAKFATEELGQEYLSFHAAYEIIGGHTSRLRMLGSRYDNPFETVKVGIYRVYLKSAVMAWAANPPKVGRPKKNLP